MQLKDIHTFMVIGAHCDDVDIRCGGTFARLVREGKRGCYVVAVENVYTDPCCHVENSQQALAIRRAESTKASEILGADRLEWLGLKSFYFSTSDPKSRIFPSFNSLESLQEELKDAIFSGLPPVANADRFPACRDRLNHLIEEFSPQVIFTNSPDDRHSDHYALSRFIETMVRTYNNQGKNIGIYFCEPGSRGPIVSFDPNYFVELSEDDVSRKQRAIDCYVSQFPNYITNTFAIDRASAYGRLVNIKYAEAFRKGSCDPSGAWEGRPGFIQLLELGSGKKEVYRLQTQST